jgi:hypothetical protein
MGAPVPSLPRPVSLVAERAVRFLRERPEPVRSARLAAAVLSTTTSDDEAARRVLEAAFGGDPRLLHGRDGWTLSENVIEPDTDRSAERDRVLIFLQGAKPATDKPFELSNVSVLRLRGEEVVGACGGDTPVGPASMALRSAVLEVLTDTTVVAHDPPGSLRAFEAWLGESLDAPISLRRLAQVRLGLSAGHDLEMLAARLGLGWRGSEDPLDQADLLDACLKALRRGDETLDDLRVASSRGDARPIEWSRYAFGRRFLREIPRVAGTYRFFDTEDRLLYVGKSKNLNARIGSYFRDGLTRSPRVQSLLDRLFRIEYDATGSELEAILREAEQIRRDKPESNIQRHVHEGRGSRLRSILILEPAQLPHVLRAYLIHEGRLVARVGIGPRGGGLKRIERALHDHFFFAPDGPSPTTGPDLDVELVVRWLATARDRAVAFDPTTLRSPQEVTDRLRWFLDQGSPFDPDGAPIFTR